MIVYVETNFLLEIIFGGRGKERILLNDQLSKQLSQLKRSVYHTGIVPLIQELSPKIVRIEQDDLAKLEATFLQLLQTASPINLTTQIYEDSLRYQADYSLSPPDAIVYASIVSHLQQQSQTIPKLFISKNTKDFNQDDLKKELRAYSCRYLGKFEHALSYIHSQK